MKILWATFTADGEWEEEEEEEEEEEDGPSVRRSVAVQRAAEQTMLVVNGSFLLLRGGVGDGWSGGRESEGTLSAREGESPAQRTSEMHSTFLFFHA